jgi:hypothetical protein
MLAAAAMGLASYGSWRRRQKRSSSLAGEASLSGKDEPDLQAASPAVLSLPLRWTNSARRAA